MGYNMKKVVNVFANFEFSMSILKGRSQKP